MMNRDVAGFAMAVGLEEHMHPSRLGPSSTFPCALNLQLSSIDSVITSSATSSGIILVRFFAACERRVSRLDVTMPSCLLRTHSGETSTVLHQCIQYSIVDQSLGLELENGQHVGPFSSFSFSHRPSPNPPSIAKMASRSELQNPLLHPLLFLYQILQFIIAKLLAPNPPPSGRHLGRPKIAVIGAGITGVTAAAHCVGHGFDVVIFENGGRDQVGGIWSVGPLHVLPRPPSNSR